ncbi:c-type cytochrome [Ramlibacter rhizophilus]|nr:c-type cytochrome [Ramlibacter rhizophilus]
MNHCIRPLAAAMLAAATTCAWAELPGPASADPTVARGRYLVGTSGCMDCHTPMKMGANGPEWDMSRLLAGHPEGLVMPPVPKLPEGPWQMIASGTNTAWAGPWGVSFTANLTPDMETGLGRWSERDFMMAIRTGKHQGRGRDILPPMPIPVYKNYTDDDLKAVFAFLRTIPPVRNRVPEPWAPGAQGPAKPTK